MEPTGDHPLPPPRTPTAARPAPATQQPPPPPGAPQASGIVVDPSAPPPPNRAAPEWSPTPSPPSAVPGQLTPTWRILLALAWMAAFFAYAAIWQASVQLGIGTWWIGPRAQPAPAIVRLLPFFVCLVMTVLVVYGVRWLPRIGMLLALGLVALSVPDFSRSVSLAVTELLVAVALLATSAASSTGLYRAPASVPESSAADR